MEKNPFSLTHKLGHYRRIYVNNHRVFCYRFIETFRLFYMNDIIDICVKHNISSEMLDWGFYTTDIFLCLVRFFLDEIMVYSHKTVAEVMENMDFENIFRNFTNELRIQFLV